MIHKNWQALIGKHFDFTQTNLPESGDRITGIVVANAPFGIWLDIGVGIPGLLQIPELDPTKYLPQNYPEWMPEIGEEILATVIWFEERPIPQILLSQKSLDKIN